jgi:GDP/UDP-N,N'-diacetylbacillosamine 2-epimerase (hydrolysing)
MRHVCYVTGSRADFGLFSSTLRAIHSEPGLSVSVAVTGMHLDPRHGLTVRDVEASDLPICARVESPELDGTGLGMAMALGTMVRGLATCWHADRPDVVIVLGDRGEMLGGALAAAHLDIPVAHVHGGERSGTIDESIRHATSKLAHLHMVSTEQSRARLERMGERPERIWVTGAPGLDGLRGLASLSRFEVCESLGFEASRPVALMAYHPVLQDQGPVGARHASCIAECLHHRGFQVLALAPNADAGGLEIREALEDAAARGLVRLAVHLPRREFVSLMACSDVMIGNSSAGIIEAATFGTPVINIGDRQAMRERNANVIDAPPDAAGIAAALARASELGRFESRNVYGDGMAGRRIVGILGSVELGSSFTRKCNAF